MLPMTGTDDFATPRNVGHFCLALDPDRFIGLAAYDALMSQYLSALRSSPTRSGVLALAPGDREWMVETERAATGIPIDRETAALLGLL
jgi:LDH2 family malate/lactate/ureidoglycolate dehydrogenase